MEEIPNKTMDVSLCKKLKFEQNKNKTKMLITSPFSVYVYSVYICTYMSHAYVCLYTYMNERIDICEIQLHPSI